MKKLTSHYRMIGSKSNCIGYKEMVVFMKPRKVVASFVCVCVCVSIATLTWWRGFCVPVILRAPESCGLSESGAPESCVVGVNSPW